MKPTCSCGTALEYRADLGAPGKGQSWDCPSCGESYWVYGSSVQNWKDVDPEAVELTVADVI